MQIQKYIGLLTDAQKRAGCFITQDDDFIFLWHGRNGHPDVIAIYPYQFARVKQIRDDAEKWLKEDEEAA